MASVSVIIPTKYRPADVQLTVKSVLEQTVLPRQLIVADQSPSNETRNGVESQYAGAPATVRASLRLSYIHDSTIEGAAAARNRGMDAAQEDIWLFLDDDVRLEPDFLRNLLAVYQKWPRVGGVSGIFTNYLPPSRLFRLWSSVFLRGPFHDERQPIYWRARELRYTEPIRVRKLTGALMSFRAGVIRGLRFDENIRGTSAEDADFCFRLQPDTPLVIAPAARLEHSRSLPGRSQTHWLLTGLESAYYLYRRHWSFGVRNRLWLVWLMLGYAFAATLSSLRRRSLAPWRALRDAIRLATLEVSGSKRSH